MVDFSKPVELSFNSEWHPCEVRYVMGEFAWIFCPTVHVRGGEIFGRDNPSIRNVPEKKLVAFTLETFPKGMVWIQSKGMSIRSSNSRSLVVGTGSDGVTASYGPGLVTWKTLLMECRMSLDGGVTWKPCGIEQ